MITIIASVLIAGLVGTVLYLVGAIGYLIVCDLIDHLKHKNSQRAIEKRPDYVAIDRMEYDMDICGVATDKRERDEQQRLKSIADAKAMMEKYDAEDVEYNCITNGYGDIVAVTPIFSPGGYQPGTTYEKYDEYGLVESRGKDWSHTYARNAIHEDFSNRWKTSYRRREYGYDETDFGSAYINPGDIVSN